MLVRRDGRYQAAEIQYTRITCNLMYFDGRHGALNWHILLTEEEEEETKPKIVPFN